MNQEKGSEQRAKATIVTADTYLSEESQRQQEQHQQLSSSPPETTLSGSLRSSKRHHQRHSKETDKIQKLSSSIKNLTGSAVIVGATQCYESRAYPVVTTGTITQRHLEMNNNNNNNSNITTNTYDNGITKRDDSNEDCMKKSDSIKMKHREARSSRGNHQPNPNNNLNDKKQHLTTKEKKDSIKMKHRLARSSRESNHKRNSNNRNDKKQHLTTKKEEEEEEDCIKMKHRLARNSRKKHQPNHKPQQQNQSISANDNGALVFQTSYGPGATKVVGMNNRNYIESDDDDDDYNISQDYHIGEDLSTSIGITESGQFNDNNNNNGFITVDVLDDEALAARYNLPSKEDVRKKLEQEAVRASIIIKRPNEKRKGYWKIYLIITFFIILSILFGIIFGRKTTTTRTNLPTQAPSNAALNDFEYIQQYLISISGDTLFNPSTIQYKTLEWLVYEDPIIATTILSDRQHGIDDDVPTKLIDRYALALLYFATGGPNWLIDYNFLTNSSVCNWNIDLSGVHCNTAGDVVRIRLNGNKLNGTIPSELSSITSLEYISIAVNSDLYGTIPESIGDLINLNILQLAVNSLTGPIPNSFSKLSNLEGTHLGYNQLSGTIPKGFTAINGLERLWLQNNLLNGTIPNFDITSNEVDIFLRDNLLEGTIPESLLTTTGLEYLNLANNDLTGTISSYIGTLTQLEELHLDKNKLTGILPTTIGNIEYLTTLSISSNYMNGSLPTELSRMFALTYLNIQENEFIGTIPSQFGTLHRLINFLGNKNDFTGTLPSTLSSLTRLETLDFSNNSISGSLDDIFCKDDSNMLFLFNIGADCGGSIPEVACTCCSKCCDDSSTEDCQNDLNQVCTMSSQLVETGQAFNDENLQNNKNNCECTSDGSSFSCGDSDCESCNENGTICGINTNYGYNFTDDGQISSWKSSFRYEFGRNETISIEHTTTNTCTVHVDGKECNSCAFSICRDEFFGFAIECNNVVKDEGDGGYYNTCEDYEEGGIFEVFNMLFRKSWTGCIPTLDPMFNQ